MINREKIGDKMIIITIGRVATTSSKDTTSITMTSDTMKLLRTNTNSEKLGTLVPKVSHQDNLASYREFNISKESQFTRLTTTVTP
jgi:hypothetical protein